MIGRLRRQTQRSMVAAYATWWSLNCDQETVKIRSKQMFLLLYKTFTFLLLQAYQKKVLRNERKFISKSK